MAAAVRIGRRWQRPMPGSCSDGSPAYLMLSGPDDVSGAHLGYEPDCSWCWLAAPHSSSAHHAEVARARRDG